MNIMIRIPLDYTVTLNTAQFNILGINEYGLSDLYEDSIFSEYSYNSEIPSGPGLTTGSIQKMHVITRLSKETLDLPLNTAVLLTENRIRALMIKEDGSSRRPELQDFTFTVSRAEEPRSYIVVKKTKTAPTLN